VDSRARGAGRTIELVHERPWATVLRVPLADGVAWFKACAPVQAFEPRPSAVAQRLPRPPNRLAPVAETAVARTLFAPLGPTYDRYAALLSLGQDPRWRRFLVSRVDAGPADTVLDVATGTGAVALELLRQKNCTVVGLDPSPEMLEEARRRLPPDMRLVEGDAESLPFPDGAFDAVTFAYPLRYVADVAAALCELARVIRPGGTLAGLEFGIPRGVWRPAWELYARAVLPLAGRVISPGWHAVGSFLGPSIRDFYARWPEPKLLELWCEAGIADVQARRLSLGGGIVTWGHRS
jgi:demethylmenaquinone methyltransferase/2-methoxy-6-polyprenyl-1,4-benzoquinol methylase